MARIQIPYFKHEGRVITDYKTSYDSIYDDEISFTTENNLIQNLKIRDGSIIDIPKDINIIEKENLKILGWGIYDKTSLFLEKKKQVTLNQMHTQREIIPLDRISSVDVSKLKPLIVKLKFKDKEFYSLVSEIDHELNYFVARFSNLGISMKFKYRDLIEGAKEIKKLHEYLFKIPREFGVKLMKLKVDEFEREHKNNPVNVDEEADKERKSFERGRIIQLHNDILMKQYELQKSLWYSLGGSSRDFAYKYPEPQLLVHTQYYAHSEWSEIAQVYSDTSKSIYDSLLDWDNCFRKMPSSSIKSLASEEFPIDEYNKIKAIGRDTIEGFYKINIQNGNFKLYFFPGNEGGFEINVSSSISRTGYRSTSYAKGDFTYRLETSADKSHDKIIITSIDLDRNTKLNERLEGSSLEDYELSSVNEKLKVSIKEEDLKYQRLRNVVLKTIGGVRQKARN